MPRQGNQFLLIPVLLKLDLSLAAADISISTNGNGQAKMHKPFHTKNKDRTTRTPITTGK